MIAAEILIKTTIDSMIRYAREDYAEKADKSESLIAMIFDGVKYEGYDFYDEAVSLIMAGVEKQRRLETRMMFDIDRANIPTVHITMPSEEPTDNSVGFDPEVDDQGFLNYSRRYKANYGLIITSDNKFEVLIIYYFLQAMIICIVDTLSLEGLENLVIRGNDIKLMTDSAPQGLTTRSINIEVTYDKKVTISRDVLVGIRNLVFTGNPKY